MIKNLKDYQFQIYYGILVAYLAVAYMGFGKISELNLFSLPYHKLGHEVDGMFNVHPFAAMVYLSYYFILVCPAFLFKDKNNLKELSINLLIASTVAHLCFLLFPVMGPNRIPLDDSILVYEIMNSLYRFDTPLNCFPSLHVAHSVLIAYYALNESQLSKSLKVILMGLALFMGPAAVAVRQHYSADVIGAFALVLFSTWLVSSKAYESAWESIKKALPEKLPF
jgi:membrane-associated phospholipid phosphatase